MRAAARVPLLLLVLSAPAAGSSPADEALVTATPLHGGEVLPAGWRFVRMSGGVILGGGVRSAGEPPTPAAVVPLPTFDVEVGAPLSSRVDLRLRLQSTGIVRNQAQGALRIGLVRAGRWSLSARAHLDLDLLVVPYGELLVGGELASGAALGVTGRHRALAVSLEAGATAAWLAASSAGRSHLDARPRFEEVRVALCGEWLRARGHTLEVRAELAVAAERDPTLALAGYYPRLTVGGSWEWADGL